MSKKIYNLDEQIGFLLRKASQRHLSIFAKSSIDVTPTQLAAMAKLRELGPLSQNHLGRETAMDAATIKGVIDRLVLRGYVKTAEYPSDKRRLLVNLSEVGRAAFEEIIDEGLIVSDETLKPLSESEQMILIDLLNKII